MTRKEMYNKMKTIDGYGVIKTFDDGSKNYYFYEVFPGDTHKDTLYRMINHGINFEKDIVLKYNYFFEVIFRIDKVYKVSEEYAKQFDLWYRDRITKSVFDASINYKGATTIDCALSY